jgi:phage gpG-like protein
VRVNITVDDAPAHAQLTALRARAGTLRPALLAIADDFHADEAELFAGRAHWKPLDPAWAARKAELGFGGRTLVLRGHLEESLVSAGAKWSVQEISDNELLVGTKDPVAHLHQAGTKKMPARQPVRTTHETQRRWATMLHDWLVGGGG